MSTELAGVWAALLLFALFVIERARPLVAAIMELFTERILNELRAEKHLTAKKEDIESLRIEVAQNGEMLKKFQNELLEYRKHREEKEKEMGR